MKTTKELIIADITAKVEAKLASQKVELSLVGELMDLDEFVNLKANQFEKTIDEILTLKTKAAKEKDDLLNPFESFESVLKEVEASYKELGLDWKSESLKIDADKTIKKVNDVIAKSEKK
jgi:hypothetical protein